MSIQIGSGPAALAFKAFAEMRTVYGELINSYQQYANTSLEMMSTSLDNQLSAITKEAEAQATSMYWGAAMSFTSAAIMAASAGYMMKSSPAETVQTSIKGANPTAPSVEGAVPAVAEPVVPNSVQNGPAAGGNAVARPAAEPAVVVEEVAPAAQPLPEEPAVRSDAQLQKSLSEGRYDEAAQANKADLQRAYENMSSTEQAALREKLDAHITASANRLSTNINLLNNTTKGVSDGVSGVANGMGKTAAAAAETDKVREQYNQNLANTVRDQNMQAMNAAQQQNLAATQAWVQMSNTHPQA